MCLMGVAAVPVSGERPAPLDVGSVGVTVTSVPALGFFLTKVSLNSAARSCIY